MTTCPPSAVPALEPQEDLEGEILGQRYVVLEPAGPLRYLVYDLQTLRRVHLHLLRDASGRPSRERFLVPAAIPPPLPPADQPAEPPSSAPDALEVAWFAQGERFDEADPLDEDASGDYGRHQENLERLADELTSETYHRYALKPRS